MFTRDARNKYKHIEETYSSLLTENCLKQNINPLNPKTDQHQISPGNINAL